MFTGMCTVINTEVLTLRSFQGTYVYCCSRTLSDLGDILIDVSSSRRKTGLSFNK